MRSTPRTKTTKLRPILLSEKQRNEKASAIEQTKLRLLKLRMRPPCRSSYDFRRVLVRLPRMSKEDPQQAMRLLLGLHERFWHAGAGDLQSMPSRAGVTAETLKLVLEVIASGCQLRNMSPIQPIEEQAAASPKSQSQSGSTHVVQRRS